MKLLLGALCVLALTGPAPAANDNVDDFFRDFTDTWVRGSPNLATSSRYFTGAEQDRLERQLDPETRAYRLERIRLAQQGLEKLRQFDRGRMTAMQRVSADLLAWQLGIITREEPYLDYTFPLEQMNGVNVRIIETLTVRHPLATERDAENYVAALGQVATRMEEATAEAQRLAAKHMIPPRFILRATIDQMRQFASTPAAQNPFVSVFSEKTKNIAGLPAAKRTALVAEAGKLVESQIDPAWNKGVAALDAMTAQANDDAGLWRFQGGSQAYAYFLERYTTTHMTPEQIHEIGLKRVTEIEAQMDQILRKMGRTQGTVKERIAQLDRELHYPETEAGRAQIMADIQNILQDALKRSQSLFDLRPKSPVVAQAFPRFREANAAANYNVPAPDGSRPGVFQYPLRPSKMTKFGLRSTVYHETVPGHHFQIALEMENPNLPRFRRIRAFGNISALGEGWGLYAERLAAESGWYDGDPAGLLGQLDSELFRARRLVVDTGIHAMHWTLQQGIDFGIERSEVERYVVFPGQACSYMMGELKILELRERTRKALGSKFSIYEFHDAVLRAGTVPLDMLEQQVAEYVKARGGKL